MDPNKEFSFQAPLRVFYWGLHAVEVDTEIIAHIKSLGSKRVIAVLVSPDGEVTQHCTFNRHEDGFFFIQVSSKAVRQLRAEAGDLLSVRIRNDDTLYQCEFPEAMETVLALDPLAKEAFDKLKPGTVRSFLFWVLAVKATDKQIERALAVADGLKAGMTSPNQVLKLLQSRK